MAIGGRIECTNYATTCHRLATTEIDGKPYCPSCATGIHGPRGGYVRTRYNERTAQGRSLERTSRDQPAAPPQGRLGSQAPGRRQPQVMVATSGLPGSTIAGVALSALGGAVCGSTQTASCGTV